ncbi:hypothetical protein PG995_013829 [Apiospora arundinis]
METETANKAIEEWISNGLMVPARIMERLDVEAAECSALGDDELSQLQKTLSAIDGQALTPAALLHLLQTRVGLPSINSEEIANILFRCLWYLSTLPFPPSPSEEKVPASLTPTQVTRGLAWLLPGRCGAMISQGNLSRSRTAADHRRVLFQSMATAGTGTGEESDAAEAAAREDRAARNATEGVDRYQGWSVVNRDADGDEIFHDLMEVLYSTQPKGPVWLAPVDLDGFRWAAKGIVAQLPSSSSATSKLPSLYSLGVPTAQLVAVVRLALAARPLLDEDDEDTDEEDADEAERPRKPVVPLHLPGADDAAVEQVVAPFCGGKKDTQIITWPMFDDALRENPELFNPLFEVVSRALFDRSWETTV